MDFSGPTTANLLPSHDKFFWPIRRMDRFSPVIRISARKPYGSCAKEKPMQFALMIYHTPEEFDMRKDYSHPHIGAWRAYYKRSWRPVSTSAGMRLKYRKRGRPCGFGQESAACRMDPTLIRRSSWRGSSFWNCLPLTLPSTGLHAVREHLSAQWKSAR